jgi:hypothetical protein
MKELRLVFDQWSKDSTVYKISKSALRGYSTAPIMAFLTKPSDGKVRITSSLTRCRELMCSYFLYNFTGKKSGNILSPLDKNTPRIMFHYNPQNVNKVVDIESKITNSLRAINVIERHLKWPLSKAYRLRIEDKSMDIGKAFMFVGCKKWTFSQHILSAYIFLIRAFSGTVAKTFAEISSYDKLKAFFSSRRSIGLAMYDDSENIKNYLNDVLLFLENMDKIYEGRSKEENFSASALGARPGSTPGDFEPSAMHTGIISIVRSEEWERDRKALERFELIKKSLSM